MSGPLERFGGVATREAQLAQLSGMFWARGTVVMFGLLSALMSLVLVGLPFLYASMLAWQGLDAAAAAARSGDDAQFVGAARLLTRALKVVVISYAAMMGLYILFYVLFVAFAVVLGAAGASLD